MSLYAMVVEDHEVRLYPLDAVEVLDIPDRAEGFAHDLEDAGERDLLAQHFLPGEDIPARITRMGAIVTAKKRSGS